MFEETKHRIDAPWNKKVRTDSARDQRVYRSHMR